MVYLAFSNSETVRLATLEGFSFYKVRVSGPVTNANVRATCEAAGLGFPCHYRHETACGISLYWSPACTGIVFSKDDDFTCTTVQFLSYALCGTAASYRCPPLDHTFVYIPLSVHNDSAWGTDVGAAAWPVNGADYSDMFALCVGNYLHSITLYKL
ncbi:uncharacterized protein [Branchiostoma lanceolatum]|uniref:uncharacterized protein n=1 Tax=Branchiostoma lanceolatum TaxID=7740 RepID=UPI0034570D13